MRVEMVSSVSPACGHDGRVKNCSWRTQVLALGVYGGFTLPATAW